MTRNCERCGESIEGLSILARFCSSYCQKMTWHEKTYSPKTPPPMDRLMAHVERTEGGCLEWTAANFGARQYGAFSLDGKTIGSHRAHWMLVNGDIPDGLILRHKCDNPLCVDLDHLELGTPADNAQDSIERGRKPVREKHGMARLKWVDVREIRAAHANGSETNADLARRFSVTVQHIGHIVNDRLWRDDPEKSPKGHLTVTATFQEVKKGG